MRFHYFTLLALIIVSTSCSQSSDGFEPKNHLDLAQQYDVVIERDNLGVPHIMGKTDADTAFGFAFAQAEDNWQLVQDAIPLYRGTNAKYQGPEAAIVDYLVGWLGIWDTIDEKVHVYPSDEAVEKIDIDVSDFHALPHEKKLEAIEMVLDRSIRFQLSQDGGGVDIKGLEGNEVQIHYQGACGDCPSSLTGTLQHIDKLIKQQLDSDLTVKSV